MTSLSDIRTAWDTYVFNRDAILAFTDRVIFFEWSDTSQTSLDDLYFDGYLNFIECVVSKIVRRQVIGGSSTDAEIGFRVDLRYTREFDEDGSNHQAVLDFFEKILTQVSSSLGTTWQGNVDFFEYSADDIALTRDLIQETDVWRGTKRFEGIKFDTL